jgi:hypothetical protein
MRLNKNSENMKEFLSLSNKDSKTSPIKIIIIRSKWTRKKSSENSNFRGYLCIISMARTRPYHQTMVDPPKFVSVKIICLGSSNQQDIWTKKEYRTIRETWHINLLRKH